MRDRIVARVPLGDADVLLLAIGARLGGRTAG